MNRDKQIDSKNLLYIAMESGFNSKTTFNVFFKKHTRPDPFTIPRNFKKNSQ